MSGLFPILIAVGTVSCTDPTFCWPVEGVLLLASVLAIFIYRGLKNKTPGLTTTLWVGLLVIGPISLILGIFSNVLLSSAASDRIIDASRGVLEFDSFLTVGWTIGFNLMGNWLREIRELRRTIIAVREVNNREADELLRISQNWSKSAFPEVASSILLVLISAFFAVAGILTGYSTSLFLALTFLSIAAISMVIAWYDLFSKSQRLSFLVDTRPRRDSTPTAPPPS
jgi:hypothetical protein